MNEVRFIELANIQSMAEANSMNQTSFIRYSYNRGLFFTIEQ